MNSRFLLVFTTIALLLSACDKDDDSNNTGAIRIPDKADTNQTFAADETQGTINITADADWTSQISETTSGTSGTPTWVSINPSNGSKTSGTKVTITLITNGSGVDRSADIVFNCDGDTQTVKITQKATNKDGTTPETPGVPDEGVKLVSKITITPDWYDSHTELTFQYDELNRVTGITSIEKYDEDTYNTNIKITYGSNSILMNMTEISTDYPDEPSIVQSNASVKSKTTSYRKNILC